MYEDELANHIRQGLSSILGDCGAHLSRKSREWNGWSHTNNRSTANVSFTATALNSSCSCLRIAAVPALTQNIRPLLLTSWALLKISMTGAWILLSAWPFIDMLSKYYEMAWYSNLHLRYRRNSWGDQIPKWKYQPFLKLALQWSHQLRSCSSVILVRGILLLRRSLLHSDLQSQ